MTLGNIGWMLAKQRRQAWWYRACAIDVPRVWKPTLE